MNSPMDEDKARREIARLLLYIYQEWNKEITKDLVNLWRDALRGNYLHHARMAAKLLVQRKPYGEPKLGDFMECLVEVKKYAKVKRDYNPWITEADQQRNEKREEMKKLLSDVVKEVKQIDGGKENGRRCLPEPEVRRVRKDTGCP